MPSLANLKFTGKNNVKLYFFGLAFLYLVLYGWMLTDSYFMMSGDDWAILYRVSMHPWGTTGILPENFRWIPGPNPHLIGDRQVSWLIFSFFYKVFGLNANWYGFLNLSLNFINGLLVYSISGHVLKNKYLQVLAATFFIFIFNNHTTLAGVVYFIDIVCTFFLLLTALFFLKPGTINKIISLFFFILDLRSKEFAIVFPGVLFFLQFALRGEGLSFSVKFKKSLLSALPYGLLVIFYILIGGLSDPITNVINNLNHVEKLFALESSGRPFEFTYGMLPTHLDYYLKLFIGNASINLFYALLVVTIVLVLLKDVKTLCLEATFLLLLLPAVFQKATISYLSYASQPFFSIFLVSMIASFCSRTLLFFKIDGDKKIANNLTALIVYVLLISQYSYFSHVNSYPRVWDMSFDRKLYSYLISEYPKLPDNTEVRFYSDNNGNAGSRPHSLLMNKDIQHAIQTVYQNQTILLKIIDREYQNSFSIGSKTLGYPVLHIWRELNGWHSILINESSNK